MGCMKTDIQRNTKWDAAPPQWAVALLATVDPTIGLQWHSTKGTSRFGTCAGIRERVVYMHFPPQETPEARWIVLHEAAHIMSPVVETLRGRRSYHGPKFCAMALRLFLPHADVMEFAKANEYKTVRRYLVENTGGTYAPPPRWGSKAWKAQATAAAVAACEAYRDRRPLDVIERAANAAPGTQFLSGGKLWTVVV